MFNVFPVRKFIKLFGCKRATKKSELTSLTECLEKKSSEKRYTFIYILVSVVTLICCIHLHSQNGISLKRHYNILRFLSSEDASTSTKVKIDETLPLCSANAGAPAQVFVNKSVKDIDEVNYPAVKNGGYYIPEKCRSRHKVALIVPYRNRKEHLAIFIFNIHKFLMKQNLEYRIFIIEQKGNELFNRGRLLNAGYLEVRKYGNWRCVVFHDVDLLPLDERILYSCPLLPRHMCAAVVEITTPKFRTIFGGVSAMIPTHFEKVNGYSNLFWGWGGEDNDLFWRIRFVGLPVVRYNKEIARYTSLQHDKLEPNKWRFNLLRTTKKRRSRDGLTTLVYTVESVTLYKLYTHLMIDINPLNENITELMMQQMR